MSLNARADELRKSIKRTVNSIRRLEEKRSELDHELMGIETNCKHDWQKPSLVKGTKDRYQKTCLNCGLTKHSKDVSIKF